MTTGHILEQRLRLETLQNDISVLRQQQASPLESLSPTQGFGGPVAAPSKFLSLAEDRSIGPPSLSNKG
jgi:hypothetical protein